MNIRTLIVEDDPMVSDINRRFLQKVEHFQFAGVCKHGEEAFQQIKKGSVDLLLLDVYMPHLSGMELLRKIRAAGMKIDVILITAANAPETIEEAMRLGIVDCILKPFDFERFRNALYLYKKRYRVFQSQTPLNQERIDSLQHEAMNEKREKEELPKGIDGVTLQFIRNALCHAPAPMSIQELSERLELSRITLRKYLEYLADHDEIALKMQYSTKGRPTKLYRYK